MTSLEGKLLSGRYRIEAELGSGGVGAVYRAEHTLMHKRCAIKVLHRETSSLPEIRERFNREAMAASHIDHPNVASASDFGELEDGSFFLVLEFVDGISLRDVIDHGPMDLRRAIHIARQIVSALVSAHGIGIVHRDLKPENIMLVRRDDDPDFVKVLDFGIAKVPIGRLGTDGGQGRALTQAGMVFGTPEYMAPEQALGQDVDGRADLYALGIILYEMLTGRRPFEAESPVRLLGMQITNLPPPFKEIAPSLQIPNEVEALVMELLEKEAAQRPSDAKQARNAFDLLDDTLRAKTGNPSPDTTHVGGSQPNASSAIAHAQTLLEPLHLASIRASITSSHANPTPIKARLAQVASRITSLLSRNALLMSWFAAAKAKLATVQASIPSIQERVAKVPGGSTTVLGVAIGAATVFAMLVGSAVVRSCSADTAQPLLDDLAPMVTPLAPIPRPTTANDSQLQRASEGGIDAIEHLFQSFPNDPEVLRRVAEARLNGSAPDTAVDLYTKLFALAPAMLQDSKLINTCIQAGKNKDSQDAVFAILLGPMGANGAEVVYDMVFTKRQSGILLERSINALRSPDFRKVASPTLLVATDLRFATTCEGKRQLLERAKEHGDQRTLAQLHALASTKGCGPNKRRDCWPCLRDGKLDAAILAIHKRTKIDPKPSPSAQ